MSNPTDPHIEVVRVTPKMATEWLTHNSNNRSVRRNRVRQYASEMQRGQWRFTGDPIRFNVDGVLIDGQHRLMALVESGVGGLDMLVIRELGTDVFPVIDSGLSRSPGDSLALMGFSNVAAMASIIRVILVIDSGLSPMEASSLTLVTRDDITKFAVENRERIQQAADVGTSLNNHPGGNGTSWGAFYWYAHHAHPVATTAFVSGIQTGANLSPGDPRLTLREYFLRMRSSDAPIRRATADRGLYLGLMIRTFNLFITGKELHRVQSWSGEGDFPTVNRRVTNPAARASA